MVYKNKAMAKHCVVCSLPLSGGDARKNLVGLKIFLNVKNLFLFKNKKT